MEKSKGKLLLRREFNGFYVAAAYNCCCIVKGFVPENARGNKYQEREKRECQKVYVLCVLDEINYICANSLN